MQQPLYAVYGAGGYGREVMPLARAQLQAQMLAGQLSPERLVFIVDGAGESRINGQQVMSYQDFLAADAVEKHVAIAIANSVERERLAQRLSADGIGAWTLQAMNSVIMDQSIIADGAILSPFVTITSNASIGAHFHANIYSYVAHDCVIGDFVTFAPGVKCNGHIVVEDHAYIGTGAILRPGSKGAPLIIGRGAVIGMGAVVTKNVAAGETVVGNPARALQK